MEKKASDGVFWAMALRDLMLAVASQFWPCAGGDQAGPGRLLLRVLSGRVFSKALVSALLRTSDDLCMFIPRSWPFELVRALSQ